MVVFVNGQEESVEVNANIQTLLAKIGQEGKGGIAVAINEVVVPKGEWGSAQLQENDKVLIIKASQGG